MANSSPRSLIAAATGGLRQVLRHADERHGEVPMIAVDVKTVIGSGVTQGHGLGRGTSARAHATRQSAAPIADVDDRPGRSPQQR
jgi:hypothetical protein